jgi:hypothetical protein
MKQAARPAGTLSGRARCATFPPFVLKERA